MNRLLLLPATMALLIALLIPTAFADRKASSDPNETDSRLDVQAIWHDHSAGDVTRVKHGIRTYNAWRSRALRNGRIWIYLRHSSRVIELTYRGGLKARMYDAGGELIGRPDVWRKSDRDIVVAFPLRWIGSDLTHYGWFVDTTWGPTCDDTPNARNSCPAYVDRAPNEGPVVHGISG